MIRRCDDHDFEPIWAIINDGARAYKGVIPEDCWTEPYMSKSELRYEIDDGVAFWGYEEGGKLVTSFQNSGGIWYTCPGLHRTESPSASPKK